MYFQKKISTKIFKLWPNLVNEGNNIGQNLLNKKTI